MPTTFSGLCRNPHSHVHCVLDYLVEPAQTRPLSTLVSTGTCIHMPTASLCSAGTCSPKPQPLSGVSTHLHLSLKTTVLTCTLSLSALYIYMHSRAQCHPWPLSTCCHKPSTPSVPCRHLHKHDPCISLTSAVTCTHTTTAPLTQQGHTLTYPLPPRASVHNYPYLTIASL